MAGRPAICRDLPGWAWVGTKLEAIDSVRAILERGGVVKGRCKTAECRRSVTVDLKS